MITQENFRSLLQSIGFELEQNSVSTIYSKTFEKSGAILSVDFSNKRLIYPNGLTAERETTKNFHQPENFVVFECVAALLDRGYYPEQIILEKGMPGGHGDTGGFCDIIVKDNDDNEYLLIECKTTEQTENDEFSKAWKLMLLNGGQLFNYYNSYRKAHNICLYTSDWVDNKCKRTYHVISMLDNKDYLLSNRNLLSFEEVTRRGGNRDEYFQVWKNTYQHDYSTKGIFEEDIAPFKVGKKKFTIEDLQVVDSTAIQKKYNQFATIMRQYNVSGRENAFDKLVNLFLVKIVDETRNGKELQFIWKGAAYDDYYNFQDRLQKMYQIGMKDYLNEDVTYIDNATIEETFKIQKNDPDAIKEKILEYFRQLKFFSNNDFAFLDVHNEQLFNQNAVILKEVVKMLQDIKLKTEEQNQFLGDLFEGFLDQGVKQSEGQFFTPTPIVRFLISSLPLENIIKESTNIPKVIDYACGAGHFLNEYAQQIKPFVEEYKGDDLAEYYKEIYGIEKEYRLSKVAKVSSFMYGQEGINIIYADALSDKTRIKDGSFSVLVANPPYSVKGFLETLNSEEKAKYELTAEVSDLAKNNSIETFFIERAKQLLCPGGVAAIILPSSVLSNGSIYIKCREIILKYFDIVSIVEMGSGTFGKTGTNTVTLFLRRKSENPALATHYKYRVDAWFSGNTMHDERYADSELLQRYCERIGVSIDDYKTLFVSSPNEELLKADIFKEYLEKFGNDTKAKKIKAKRITPRYTEDMRDQELQTYIIDSIKDCEKDKLYFFLLALSNPQPVVIVKSPSKTADIKKFLGYEWSSSKGNEGIKYIGANDVDEENELERNKGISQIKTPLFDPSNLHNEEKINMFIRHNYLGEDINISKGCEEFVSVHNLVDLIDFSQIEFDKKIFTKAVKKINIDSKYPLVRLGDYVETIGGLWTGSKAPFKKVFVIRNTNFTMNGLLNLSDVAQIDVEESAFEKRKLEEGDIIVEKSGGSSTQAVGRVVLFKNDGEYSFSNFTMRLRLTNNDLNSTFLYLVLNSYYQKGYTFDMQNGASGLKNLDTNKYLSLQIPFPPMEIQKKIVEECNIIDEEYESSKRRIDECKKEIDNIFVDIKKQNIQSEKLEKLYVLMQRGKSPQYGNSGVQIIKSGQARGYETFDFSTKYYASENFVLDERRLEKGDILINSTGVGTAGRVTMFNLDGDFCVDSHITIFRTNERVCPKYALYALADIGFKNIEKMANGASGQIELSLSAIKRIEIPLPSIEHQKEIISQIERYESEMTIAQQFIDSYNDKKNAVLDKYLK